MKPIATSAALSLLAATLFSCDSPPGEPGLEPLIAAAALPALIDREGDLADRWDGAVPKDARAWTRSGRYALRAQAEQLERVLHGEVLWLDAACCACDGADSALTITLGLLAERDLRRDAPVFVGGSDPPTAAYIANRLHEAGLQRVFLVPP